MTESSLRTSAVIAGISAASFIFGSCGDSADVVTLRFWGLGREGEVVQELVQDFERENPGIRVEVQQIPWTAAHEKLLTAHVGEASPDVAQLGNTWIAEFTALDALLPLDSLVAASTVVSPSGFFTGIWDTNVMDGRVYGVPWYVDTRLMFYRSDLLRAAGYERPPVSWDGWLEAMRRIKQQVGDERYAIFLPMNEWNVPVILGMQQGSPLLRDDGRYGAFTESAFSRAFEFYVDLFRAGLAPRMGLQEIANVFQEFERGLFAMYITGPWNIGEFRRRLPAELQDDWATSPLPGPSGEQSGISMAGGASLVLYRSSEHPEEAWKLIEFLSRPEQQLRFYRLTGDLPARKEAWSDTALIGNKYARPFWDQLQRVAPLPKVPEWELIATKVLDHSEIAVRGGVEPARVLESLNEEVDRILEKRRWILERKRVDG
jgi:multiple sugar transport system substrate-binding protein